MMTIAVIFGVAAWVLERLAFAILLIWGWNRLVEFADEAKTYWDGLWSDIAHR